jgi:hypothetical protein
MVEYHKEIRSIMYTLLTNRPTNIHSSSIARDLSCRQLLNYAMDIPDSAATKGKRDL